MTALANGTASIVATSEGVSDTVLVTVSQEVDFITISPRSWTFASLGESHEFTAVAYDVRGTPVPAYTTFAWATSDPAVAIVSTGEGASTSVTSVADGDAILTATAGGVDGTASLRVSSSPASVTVTPSIPAVLTRLGQELTLSATVRDIFGRVTPVPVTWTSSNQDVASVDAGGVVSAIGDGDALIVASTADGPADTVTVTVAQAVSYVEVTPASQFFTFGGETDQLTATAYDAGGTAVSSVTSFTWASTNTGVATVSTDGLVTAVADGSATVTASASEQVGTASVTVARSVASIGVTPATTTLSAVGATQALSAVAYDAGGTVLEDVVTFTWASSNESVATVSPAGLLTAVSGGSASITAAAGGVTSSAVTVTVAQAVTSVVLSPSGPATLTQVGGTVQLSAGVTDALGEPVATEVTWTSSNPAAATVSASGLVTAVADGSADITATAGGVTSSAVTVTVAQAVASVDVSPVATTLTSVGERRRRTRAWRR